MFFETKERKWVLVVDDEEDIRKSLAEVIALNCGDNVTVIEAKDGIEATTKINYQKFDCIITDLSMPKKEGEPFINSIRHNSLNENTPVIIISGAENLKIVAEQFDFVEPIEKPFKLVEITTALNNYLKIQSNKNRVSASALNNLIEGMDKFFKEILKDGVTQDGPVQAKHRGYAVEQTHVASIQFKIGKVKNTFSILANEEELVKLKDKAKLDTPVDKIMNSMSFVILKHVMGKTLTPNTSKFTANTVVYDKKMLTDKQGIVVNLLCNDLKISIFATTQ